MDLSSEKREEIRGHFEYFDRDGNGVINFEEFRELLGVISPNSKLDQALRGFVLVDTNSDGQIDFGEFIEWWGSVWWEF